MPGTHFSHPPSLLLFCILQSLVKRVLYPILINQVQLSIGPGHISGALSFSSPSFLSSPFIICYPISYHAAPYQVYPSRCRPGREGGKGRSSSVGRCENPTIRVTAWVDKGCQEQKSEQWSPLRWRMRTRQGKWTLLRWWKCFKSCWGVVYMGICICQNYRTLYLKCTYSTCKIRPRFKNFKEYSVFLKNAGAVPHSWLPFRWHGFYRGGSVWVLTHMPTCSSYICELVRWLLVSIRGFDKLSVIKGIRLGHPKICHCGMRIILNWRQLRKSRHRKSFLPFYYLSKSRA